MRRIISLMIALVLCLAAACPAFAATNPFVPSIGYKDGPSIEHAEPNGDCLIVTTIPQAKEKTTDIYQEDRDLLLEVYEKLSDGSMKLPIDDEYVIRDLVDVSWRKTTCVEAEHGHKEWLKEDNTSIEVTFDMGIQKGVEVIVMVYLDGEWVPAKRVTNNGDGTVTVEFEDICPVAFCIKQKDIYTPPPKTGDDVGRNLMIPVVLMIVSAAGLAALAVLHIRKRK